MKSRRYLFIVIAIVIAILATSSQLYAQVTEQQADQIRACILGASRVRSDANSIAGIVMAPHAERAISQQVDELAAKLLAVKQEHDNFTKGLNEDQRTKLKDAITKLGGLYEKMNSNLLKIKQQIAKPTLDRDTISVQAQTIAKSAQDWQGTYRGIASVLHVKLERG